MWDELRQVLETPREELIYIPNIGNAGDAFIAHATYQLFDRWNIRYKIGNIAGTYPGETVVCAGGGALITPYDYMINCIRRNMTSCRSMIILPHTIRSYPEVLGQLGGRSFVFCRDRPSYEFIKSVNYTCNVFLSDDLAFGCDFGKTESHVRALTFRGAVELVTNPRANVRLWRRIRRDAEFAQRVQVKGTLNAFRTDIEKTAITLPKDNLDVSEAFADVSMLPLIAGHTTYRMFRFLKRFRAVRTNRLHIAIMSAMLGREVDFYDNSYGKNRDVFEHSMRGRYPNVRWHSD